MAGKLITNRLFLALVPPLAQRDEIYKIGLQIEDGGDHVRPDHLHATIAISEDANPLPGEWIEKWNAVGEAAAARSFPFAFRLEKISGWARSIVLVPVGRTPEFHELGRTIEEEMARQKLVMRDKYARNPHVTLVYPGKDIESFSRSIAEIEWLASELVLVHSHVGLGRHDILGRWPLSAEKPQLEMAL